MRNDPVFYGEEIRNGEERIIELGHTDSVRVLFVVWTPRGNLLRPVTAFDPAQENRDEYLVQFFGEE